MKNIMDETTVNDLVAGAYVPKTRPVFLLHFFVGVARELAAGRQTTRTTTTSRRMRRRTMAMNWVEVKKTNGRRTVAMNGVEVKPQSDQEKDEENNNERSEVEAANATKRKRTQ